MLRVIAALFVFLGGFAVMVLEIIGARFLARDFGGSFYVWISQIGVILVALALGYVAGGGVGHLFHSTIHTPAGERHCVASSTGPGNSAALAKARSGAGQHAGFL